MAGGKPHLRIGLMVVLVALAGWAATGWAQRIAPESDLPVLGVGAGQVFRFGVGCPQARGRDESPNCQGTLSFRDLENRTIGRTLDVSLVPGEAAFLDLDTRILGLRPRQRINFRPVFTATPQSGPTQFSFDVLDALSGRLWAHDSSTFFLAELDPAEESCGGFPGQPVFLPALGWSQTMQFTVSRSTQPADASNMPLPCDVTVEIRDGSKVIAPW